jgi:hypothetical protein
MPKRDTSYITPEYLEKQRLAQLGKHSKENSGMWGRRGRNCSNWKDKCDGGLKALHIFIRKYLFQPTHCPSCGKETQKLDLHNISGEYKQNLNDWEYLCRYCHQKKDGRLRTWLERNKSGINHIGKVSPLIGKKRPEISFKMRGKIHPAVNEAIKRKWRIFYAMKMFEVRTWK